MSEITTLFEGVLNDDYIKTDKRGKTKLKWYTFATCWSNREHELDFYNREDAVKYYKQFMRDRVIEQGKRWRKEDRDAYPNTYSAVNVWEDYVNA